MISAPGKSPYLKRGRLEDVIVALQVMGERPEKEIAGWARELSRNQTDQEVERWAGVFNEHPRTTLILWNEKEGYEVHP